MGMKKAGTIDVEVVVPAWLMDCISLNQLIPTGPYAFPNPQVYEEGSMPRSIPEESQNGRTTLSEEQSSIFRTALVATGQKSHKDPQRSDVWQGRRFVLCDDLGVSPEVMSTLKTSISHNGGKIAHDRGEHDILICRYRDGEDYDYVSIVPNPASQPQLRIVSMTPGH